ncbi:tyrosyl-DNA phosphodiesterase 2 isoform X3 [Myotis myotis]|uniref:tyrosyl-DNA phosphodiesterase 2 isoform X3 n=1 Tax=Myotis myotis TaxID=51298 RepID=UPI00174DA16F|nr:tyrosyl-DNA phosphodiesterase 2 isoform X3 [Myotis myotis]
MRSDALPCAGRSCLHCAAADRLRGPPLPPPGGGRGGGRRRGAAAMEQKRSPETGPEAGPEDGDPAGKKRLLCADFASVAGCHVDVARRYLAENAWEVERALNAYFEPRAEEGALPRRPAPPPAPVSCVDLTNEEAPDPVGSRSGSAGPPQQEDGSMFSLVSWNVDGLDLNNLWERAQGLPESSMNMDIGCLRWYSPDVIFLQEVIPPYYSLLKKRASSYEIITGHDDGYFTAIMLKKSRVKLKSQEIIPFPNTQMMRNLLCVHVTKCGGLPSNISDVWEFLGKPKHCQYTWDTQMNSNLGIRATCKHRFDRIFFRAAAGGGHIIPQSLDLLGLEKLECGRFPSDHWGLLCTLDVIL